jgi:hypothetical protein
MFQRREADKRVVDLNPVDVPCVMSKPPGLWKSFRTKNGAPSGDIASLNSQIG